MHYTADTMLVKAQDTGDPGVFSDITAQAAGWDYLNMTARRLNAGQTWSANTGDNEWAHVILGGVCNIRTSQGDFMNLGKRKDVWSGMPHALYLSRKVDFEIEALTDGFEVASCWVPTDRDYPAQRISRGADTPVELRGGGNASRQINGIIPPGFNCHRLVAVEVYTPDGNWSSYPPHKHDVHREDADGKILEADLEEIYFYKINPPDGYAYQRVYNDSRSIDAVMLPHNHDAVLVPEGYHPVVALPGYTSYYLNFLAGSAQVLTATDDPALTWVKGTFSWLDPRVPLVREDEG